MFAGTAAIGIPCLEALFKSAHHLIAIYTQPDRPAGRGQKVQASIVKQWAIQHQLPIFQPLNFNDSKSKAELAALKPDLLVVIAYGLILPQQILTIPKLGAINVHTSLLPRWRGAAPIQYAILNGDEQTGVSIMQMDAGIDTGDLIMQHNCQITNADTAQSLHDQLGALASPVLLATIDKLVCGKAVKIVQNNNFATYSKKIRKEDALIDWNQPAIVIDRQIRAFNPWPIAYTHVAGLRLRILTAQVTNIINDALPGVITRLDHSGMLVNTQTTAILVKELQFPGAKIMTVAACLNNSRTSLKLGVSLK